MNPTRRLAEARAEYHEAIHRRLEGEPNPEREEALKAEIDRLETAHKSEKSKDAKAFEAEMAFRRRRVELLENLKAHHTTGRLDKNQYIQAQKFLLTPKRLDTLEKAWEMIKRRLNETFDELPPEAHLHADEPTLAPDDFPIEAY